MSGSGSSRVNVVAIDVSDLEPPEPMERILDRLPHTQATQVLRVHHRREPFPLYPMLDEGGYEHCCIQNEEDVFLIYIWPRSVPVNEAFCRADAAGNAR